MSKKGLDINKIKPLDDLPVDEDKFKGQSHKNVARAIVELITKTDGGYAIGLEGSWGSGKSSVISMTEEVFKVEKEESKYLFFTFDAWARLGDPVRRSFLELLIDYLINKEIIIGKNWEKTLTEIQAKSKKETKYSRPKFTRFGYMMTLYGLVFPFLVLFTRSIAEDYSYWATFGYVLFVSIIIPLLLIVVEKIIQNCKKEEATNSLIPSFKLDNHEIYTEQFIKEVDATTIEFNNYFDRLIRTIEEENKKLILVIDNLDRLPPDEIKSIWGTMRNFFTSDHKGERYELLKNVYLIVPYDRPYISEIFSEKEEDIITSSDKNEITKNTRSAYGFIDKTFKLTFNISKPILLHWKSYLYDQLDEAFEGQLLGKQKYDLYKLFEFKYQSNNSPITPRSIKKYINGIVVLCIEWENSIPIKFLGLYELQKNKIGFNYRKLVKNELFDERTRNYIEGEDWFKFIAALHHKVDVDSALQVGLGEDIGKALVTADTKELEILEENEAFEDVLEMVVGDNCKEWASEPAVFSKVAHSISRINLQDDIISQKIWDDLAKKTQSLKEIKKPSKELAEGFAKIIENCSSRYKKKVGEYLFLSLYNSIDEKERINTFTSKYVEYISIINTSLHDHLNYDDAIKLLENVKLPSDSLFNIHFAAKIFKVKGLKLEYFQLNVPMEEVNKELQAIINSDDIDDDLKFAVNSFVESEIQLDWSALAHSIQNRIKNNQPPTTDSNISKLLYVLFYLNINGKDEISGIISSLVSSGFILALLKQANESSKAKALIILELIRHYEKIDEIASNNNVGPYGNNSSELQKIKSICSKPDEHKEIVENMAEIACDLGYFHSVIDSACTSKDEYTLMQVVIEKMIEDNCINGLSVNRVIKYPDYIKFFSEEDLLESFFGLLDEEKFDTDSISELKEVSPTFIENATKFESKIGGAVIEKSKSMLSLLETDEWTNYLKEEGHEINLLISLLNLGEKEFLSEDFSQALSEHALFILNDDLSVKNFTSSWRQLPLALPKNTRKTFYERLYNQLVEDHTESGVYNLIQLFPDKIIESVDTENKADQFIKNVVIGLVNSDEVENLNWIGEHINSIKKSYKTAAEDTKGHLREVLESKSNEEDPVKSKIHSIAESLKIHLNWDLSDEEDEGNDN